MENFRMRSARAPPVMKKPGMRLVEAPLGLTSLGGPAIARRRVCKCSLRDMGWKMGRMGFRWSSGRFPHAAPDHLPRDRLGNCSR